MVGPPAYLLGKQGLRDAMLLPEVLVFENLAFMPHFDW
jgi:hypothetical protein